MTAAEIETQAEIYAKGKHCKDCSNISMCWENAIDDCCTICERTNDDFIAGAKWGAEHAIEWHDLRKDPNDLPKDEEDFKEYLVAHKNFNNPNEIVVGCFTWYGGRFLENYTYSEIPYFENKNVLYAWCELPQFKE